MSLLFSTFSAFPSLLDLLHFTNRFKEMLFHGGGIVQIDQPVLFILSVGLIQRLLVADAAGMGEDLPTAQFKKIIELDDPSSLSYTWAAVPGPAVRQIPGKM